MARAVHADQPKESAEAALRRLDNFAFLMDEAFRIPLTRWQIGWDAIAGFVPVLGDGVMALASLYLLLEARRHGAPPMLLARMLANIGVDALGGSVPIAGSVFDIAFKANRRNHRLLREHLSRR